MYDLYERYRSALRDRDRQAQQAVVDDAIDYDKGPGLGAGMDQVRRALADHKADKHKASAPAWPEGVIARYLAVGGATVDLTERITLPPGPEPYATVAACTGCTATKEFGYYRTYYPSGGFLSDSTQSHEPEAATAEARAWAQSHAERCRAMPRPA